MKLELLPITVKLENKDKEEKEWKKTSLEESSQLLQNTLTRLTLNDLPRHEEIGTAEERKKYLADAFRIFQSGVFKSEIDGLIKDQRIFISENAENADQLLYGRGILYGLALLKSRFEELHNMYQVDFLETNQNEL